ncbi:MAG TPA: ABC transporter substrate-binding protein [Solirubrobacteraceae bacterium]|jgi:putative hydroxymethylpyrimidine transport system substrate-binding protein|nr:ABC transporter substrate-binding protein [Solirubrobacteraceae bacterium]
MKRPLTVLTTLTAMLGLAACGEKTDVVNPPSGSAHPFSLMLDYYPNADHVGLYEAMADGAFKQADLAVHVQAPSDPAEPLKLLAAGKIDAAISYEPEVFLARTQDVPLVAVAAIVQKPLTSIISVGSKHITSPADLRGKSIGTAGIPYQSAYLSTILQNAGVPQRSVKQVNVGFNLVPAMLSGRVDATLGGYWNYEGLELAQERRHPNVIPVNQAGVPTYDELVVVVRKNEIVNHASLIRRFVQALGRGYEAVRANPVAAVKTLVKANPTLNYKLQLASVRAVLPDFFPTNGKPWGWQSIPAWNAFGNWMLTHNLITNPDNTVINEAADNELLAGQGLA